MKELEMSEKSKYQIEDIISSAVKELKEEMKIASIHHIQVSLDLNFTNNNFASVKYSCLKYAKLEKSYSLDKNDES